MALYAALREGAQHPTGPGCRHGNSSGGRHLIVPVAVHLRPPRGCATRTLALYECQLPPLGGDPAKRWCSETEERSPPEKETATRARSSSACWIFSATTLRTSWAVLDTFAFTLTYECSVMYTWQKTAQDRSMVSTWRVVALSHRLF